MTGLELVVMVGLAVFVGSIVAPQLRVPAPVPLLAIGIAMAAAPGVRDVFLPPDVVLFLFLPALLFWEALTSSVHSLRRYLRPILLSSTVLVVLTAGAVAVVAHLFGLDWGPAWVLGAAIAPTDATVVASMGPLLPQRTMTLLRSESLLNDGTALVIYSLAVETASHAETHVTGLDIGERFLLSVFCGVGAGLVVGAIAMWVRRRLNNPLHDTAMQILTPFAAYLLAEVAHGSGVLAVVAAGLYLMRTAPLTIGAHQRTQSTGFWSVTNFLLNGSLFVLVGMRLPETVKGLRSLHLTYAVLLAACLLLTLFLVRLAFTASTDEVARLVSGRRRRAAEHRERHGTASESRRAALISSLAGFRGAVSLAMALSVPTTVGRHSFPARDAIVFCTLFVVLGTIVLQGLALPLVVRWASLPEDTSIATALHDAEQQTTEEALDALPELARKHEVPPDQEARIRTELETVRDAAEARSDGEEDHEAITMAERLAELRADLVAVKREAMVRMRDEGSLDDEVVLLLQRQLDREELRFAGHDVDAE